jgi:cell division protease FtsH
LTKPVPHIFHTWLLRYSEFISAVENGKVERVRFSKDGTQLQLTAVDGRRATVVLPNDPDLVDILAKWVSRLCLDRC